MKKCDSETRYSRPLRRDCWPLSKPKGFGPASEVCFGEAADGYNFPEEGFTCVDKGRELKVVLSFPPPLFQIIWIMQCMLGGGQRMARVCHTWHANALYFVCVGESVAHTPKVLPYSFLRLEKFTNLGAPWENFAMWIKYEYGSKTSHLNCKIALLHAFNNFFTCVSVLLSGCSGTHKSSN